MFCLYSVRKSLELYHRNIPIVHHLLHCSYLGPSRFHLSLKLPQYPLAWFPAPTHVLLLSCFTTAASIFLLKDQIVFQTLQWILSSPEVKVKVCPLVSRCLCDQPWPPPLRSHLLPPSSLSILAFLLLLEHTKYSLNLGPTSLPCLLPAVCFPRISTWLNPFVLCHSANIILLVRLSLTLL